jgi:hypothetical protein
MRGKEKVFCMLSVIEAMIRICIETAFDWLNPDPHSEYGTLS